VNLNGKVLEATTGPQTMFTQTVKIRLAFKAELLQTAEVVVRIPLLIIETMRDI